MGNFIATQVDPENQESPLMEYGMDDIRMQEVVIIGDYNRRSGNPELIDFIKVFEEYADDFSEIIEETKNPQKALDEIIKYFDLSSKYGNDYTPSHDIAVWKVALKAVETTDYEAEVLHALTGKEYEKDSMHGAGQSDWANIVRPTEWSSDDFDHFEAEYFNTGTEWIVSPMDDLDESESIYVYAWDVEGIKREIAESLGADPKEIQLKVFDGYEKIPKYRLA